MTSLTIEDRNITQRRNDLKDVFPGNADQAVHAGSSPAQGAIRHKRKATKVPAGCTAFRIQDPALLVDRICCQFSITHAELVSTNRSKELPVARHLVSYFLSLNYDLSLTEISSYTNRCHSNVIVSIKRIEGWISTDKNFKALVRYLFKEIQLLPGVTPIRAYISGKITGLDPEILTEKFDESERKIQPFGYEIVNPLKLDHDVNATWGQYMSVDIVELTKCHMIVMQKDWTNSSGSRIEHYIAKEIGHRIVYESKGL